VADRPNLNQACFEDQHSRPCDARRSLRTL
jgi:hypothetical protein